MFYPFPIILTSISRSILRRKDNERDDLHFPIQDSSLLRCLKLILKYSLYAFVSEIHINMCNQSSHTSNVKGDSHRRSLPRIYSWIQLSAETLFPELLECRSSKTLNLYPTMAIHVPAYFHTIMQRGRTGNITLRGTATTTIIVDIHSWW